MLRTALLNYYAAIGVEPTEKQFLLAYYSVISMVPKYRKNTIHELIYFLLS